MQTSIDTLREENATLKEEVAVTCVTELIWLSHILI